MRSKICQLFPLFLLFVGTSGQFPPGTDEFIMGKMTPYLDPVDLLDGPPRITEAVTTPTTNSQPSLEDMKYHSYKAASLYCSYEIDYLNCTNCQKFKDHVSAYQVVRNSQHNTIALFTTSDLREEISVTYRGTMDIWNVILDTEVVQLTLGEKSNGIQLHTGFYVSTMSLYADVVNWIGYHLKLHPTYKVVIAGHSLGGTMARITQFFLLYNKQFPEAQYELYTYGEPRNGNRAFVSFMNNQTIKTARIVNRADFGPHVVPCNVANLPHGLAQDYYVHSQTEYWITAKEEKFCSQATMEDGKCSKSLASAYTFSDHMKYFDADFMACPLSQPFALLSFPVIFEPAKQVPPIPGPVTNYTAPALSNGFTALSGTPFG